MNAHAAPNIDVERARSALWSLDPGVDRAQWVRIGCAAKAAGLLFDDFCDWSETAGNYGGRGDTSSAWKSFKQDGGVNAGTLFHLARQAGWTYQAQAAIDKEPARKSLFDPADCWRMGEPAPADHPYIARKGGTPEGLRVVSWPMRGWAEFKGRSLQGWLMIPVRAADGGLKSIQFIGPDTGEKLNAPGCRMAGTFTVGTLENGGRVYIVEGIGHAWSVHAVSGRAAVVSFGAGNIEKAAAAIKAAGAEPILIPDRGKEDQAKAAALRQGCAIALLPGDLPDGRDVNDLHLSRGDAVVLEVLEVLERAALVELPRQELEERDEARRRIQQEENQRLQMPDSVDVLPPSMSRDEMLSSMVWIASGEQVAHVDDVTMFLTWREFRSLTSASVTLGDERKKPTPNAVLWQQDPQRKTVMTRTFHPGAGIFCRDPDGRSAINTWRPLIRRPAKADAGLFLEHVAYLFPDGAEREKFLDWLAHLEQRPGELPHYGWLHVADNTGTGRNWLASVLARVWRGYVAPNVDLPALLESQFNGQLAGRVLAIVDEVQEAAGENRYSHTNKLRSLVNAEYRDVNPKYGRQHREHNACRWLVFSNHLNALPIDDNDRRWRIIHHTEHPRPAQEYTRLYCALSDPEFINAVAIYLAERDISGFNPGERPPMNAAKLAVVGAAKTMTQKNADQLVAHWPADVITTSDISSVLSDGAEERFTPAMRRAMEEVGGLSIERPIKLDGKARRCWIIRNPQQWLAADGASIAKEARRARVGHAPLETAQEVLADACAHIEERGPL